LFSCAYDNVNTSAFFCSGKHRCGARSAVDVCDLNFVSEIEDLPSAFPEATGSHQGFVEIQYDTSKELTNIYLRPLLADNTSRIVTKPESSPFYMPIPNHHVRAKASYNYIYQ